MCRPDFGADRIAIALHSRDSPVSSGVDEVARGLNSAPAPREPHRQPLRGQRLL